MYLCLVLEKALHSSCAELGGRESARGQSLCSVQHLLGLLHESRQSKLKLCLEEEESEGEGGKEKRREGWRGGGGREEEEEEREREEGGKGIAFSLVI